jgi:hypothetical protein
VRSNERRGSSKSCSASEQWRLQSQLYYSAACLQTAVLKLLSRLALACVKRLELPPTPRMLMKFPIPEMFLGALLAVVIFVAGFVSGSLAPQREDRHDHNDQTDQIDQPSHVLLRLAPSPTRGNSERLAEIAADFVLLKSM